MTQNEFTQALVEDSKRRMQKATFMQDLYGSLINWRDDRITDKQHKAKVLRGYSNIMNFVARGLK